MAIVEQSKALVRARHRINDRSLMRRSAANGRFIWMPQNHFVMKYEN
jgi:hypothetical protein